MTVRRMRELPAYVRRVWGEPDGRRALVATAIAWALKRQADRAIRELTREIDRQRQEHDVNSARLHAVHDAPTGTGRFL